jgi:hypothetical protein
MSWLVSHVCMSQVKKAAHISRHLHNNCSLLSDFFQHKISECNLYFMCISIQRAAWYPGVQKPLYFWFVSYLIDILIHWIVFCELDYINSSGVTSILSKLLWSVFWINNVDEQTSDYGKFKEINLKWPDLLETTMEDGILVKKIILSDTYFRLNKNIFN